MSAARQRFERAAVLLGAAESARTRARAQLTARERTGVDRATDAAVTALGQDAFAAAVAKGRRMTSQDAIAAETSA